MPLLELSFASKEDSLSVRRFAVHEGLSNLFEVSIWAVSQFDDLDLEAIVGKEAAFRIVTGVVHSRRPVRLWSGVCRHIEQVQAEPTGLSTYYLRIVPKLWLLTHRRNNRIFQHKSAPDILDEVLADWGIQAKWKVDRGQYPKLEYRVQYGETDFDFVCRTLEEWGISYYFDEDEAKMSELIFADKPQTRNARLGGPISYVDNPNEEAEKEFVTRVRLTHVVKPGKLSLRDFDFRRKPDYELVGKAPPAEAPEDFYEQYRYAPGGFLVEGGKGGETPSADDKGVARHDEKAGTDRATRSLEAERNAKRNLTFDTNVIDISPGLIFSIAKHPRADLGPDNKLLITEFSVEGTPTDEWHMSARAVFADLQYRPPMKTPKPIVRGVQSAVVVGPPGEEIHTDEFGRVRVQFHWDREGKFDDNSSCWMRVSQGWAGSGFGMIMIPRIGQEVLVGFFEGDPDLPVIVGRVYNNTTRVPYKLPDHKTKSTWKSDSTPNSDGFNEIMFEDAKGAELVYMQAQRDLQKLVKNNETERTGVNRSISVGANRTAIIAANDAVLAGVKHRLMIAQPKEPPPSIPPTSFDMIDKKITYTTGEASIIFDGPNITLEAKGNITIRSKSGDVIIKGGPNVKINC
jgi:type VI secretion system secreted protein VgrG